MKPTTRDWKATCEICGEVFSYPNFDCSKQPGLHTVAEKTYYHLGAGHIQHPKERRMFAPTVHLRPDVEVRDKVTGVITAERGLSVQFRESGIYDTTNPEEQYYLDLKPMACGPEGKEAWEKMYLTSDQQLQKSQERLSDIQRQIREGNVLLDTVKRQKAGASGMEMR